MAISSDNPVNDFMKGAGEQTAKEVFEGIRKLAKKFKKGKFAFIKERETIDSALALKKSTEIKIYKTYFNNSNGNEIIFRMGLLLRRLESEKDFVRLNNLREKIKIKYSIEGVHVAQAVQNKVFFKYISKLISEGYGKDLISKRINKLIEDAEELIIFVNNEDDISILMESIKNKISVRSPVFLVISGKYSAANKVEIISESFRDGLDGYSIDKHFEKNESMLFFNKNI